MSLIGISFGGTSYNNSTAGVALDIWDCTLHCGGPSTPTITPANVDDIGALVMTWFKSVGASIATTEALEWLKVNEFDFATGHQITDPTHLKTWTTANRGSGSSENPVTTAYRVSLDDATRSRRHKGGFFPPRAGTSVGSVGRWDTTTTQGRVDAASTLINGINAYTGLNLQVGIYSRRDQALWPVTRLRVSDVPDNIRKRKSKMLPTYITNNNIS